jgi:transglutaminase-like putative cysteine protease
VSWRSAAPAAVIAVTWLRLEQPHENALRVAALVALALLPAVGRYRVAGTAVALVIAARLAYGFWWHPGRLASRFASGFLDFYDVQTPFDPRLHGEMRSVVLTAVFAFTLALALTIRRPFVAALVVLAGAGWPATLAGGSSALLEGAAILAAMLVVLARRRTLIAIPILLASTAGSAIAQGEIVQWQQWDFHHPGTRPLSVAYVWDAQYGGITFPRLRTTVLQIKAPATSLYWRAATLDAFVDDRWQSAPTAAADALEPAAARDRSRWVREQITDKALLSDRLVAGSVPVAFSLHPSTLQPGDHYTAWSYVPSPSPAQLERVPPRYPAALRPYLAVWAGVELPAFGTGNRVARMNAILDSHPEIERYVPIEHAALDVAGRARNPYAATAALETWFRSSGGFAYSDHPAVFAEAPLVGFVAETRAGYCQYFAGAMALMLRYLGVPARVAVGFSSGTYDAGRGTWTVTDHDAHAWVEVWFRGYGWLPFDPTPAAGRPERGRLAAAYVAPLPPPVGASTGSQSAFRHGEVTPSPTATPTSASSSGANHLRLLELIGLVLAGALTMLLATKLALRRLRYLRRDPRRIAAACRHELVDFLLDQRIEAARSATLHELGELVRSELAVEPDLFVAAATAARFGPPAGARPAARQARRELRLLIGRIRPRLTPLERARGLFSLRSLGLA